MGLDKDIGSGCLPAHDGLYWGELVGVPELVSKLNLPIFQNQLLDLAIVSLGKKIVRSPISHPSPCEIGNGKRETGNGRWET